MAETQYDAGTGTSIDVGSSLEGVGGSPETQHDVGVHWSIGYQQPLIVGSAVLARLIPELKRRIP